MTKRLPNCARLPSLEPDRSRFAYVYAVALHSAGRIGDAISILKQSVARHPLDRDTMMALVAFSRDAGDIDTAIAYAERLVAAFPQDAGLDRLVRELRQRLPKPTAR